MWCTNIEGRPLFYNPVSLNSTHLTNPNFVCLIDNVNDSRIIRRCNISICNLFKWDAIAIIRKSQIDVIISTKKNVSGILKSAGTGYSPTYFIFSHTQNKNGRNSKKEKNLSPF